jgi:protein TonB
MRFALSGAASLTLHGALLGAALGVAWRGPPAEAPRIEVEIVFGAPLSATEAAEPAPAKMEEPPAPQEAHALPGGNDAPPAVAAAAEDIPRAMPPAPPAREARRTRRTAAPLALKAEPEQPPPVAAMAHPAANDEQASEEGQGAVGGASGLAVALSALPWQPSEPSRPSAPPAYGGNPAPTYPAAARRRGQQGQVVVRAEVLADGRAARVEVMRSSGYALLDEAALVSVLEWRFAPAEIDGVPSAGAIEVPITFKLVD